MTDPKDKDQELENYLRGESALSQQYDAASAETPAAELDARILAAARRALRAGPVPLLARKKSWRWQVPVATAAVIVVSVAVTLRIAEQEAHQQPASSGFATPGGVEAQRATEQPGPAVEADDRKNRLDTGGSSRLQEKKAMPAPAASAAAPAAPPAPPETTTGSLAQPFRDESLSKDAQPAQELLRGKRAPVMKQRAEDARTMEESTKAKMEQRALPEAGPALAAPPAATEMQSATREEPTNFKTPELWLDHVRELRKAGESAAAAASLANFKKNYPDYALPADLQ